MSDPIAYAAVAADGSESVYVASLKEQAEACCRENGWFLLPLYAAPPTWQEEVAAVEGAFERSGVKPTWPDDEPGNIGPMADAMADEIRRLRLTDDERKALRAVVRALYSTDYDVEYVALQKMLKRLAGTDATPPPHATPTQSSVQGEGSVRDSRNANEPAAWAVRYKHADTGIVELLRTLEECRHRWANRTTDYWQYEPLYRHPPCQDSLQKNFTLTAEEREAIEWSIKCADDYARVGHRQAKEESATLRSLLERLK